MCVCTCCRHFCTLVCFLSVWSLEFFEPHPQSKGSLSYVNCLSRFQVCISYFLLVRSNVGKKGFILACCLRIQSIMWAGQCSRSVRQLVTVAPSQEAEGEEKWCSTWFLILWNLHWDGSTHIWGRLSLSGSTLIDRYARR